MPKAEIRFSIDNVNGEYNPYNAKGLDKYLMQRQEIKSRYGLKMDDGSIEWINGGTFYLSEWYAKQNGMTADFTARDLLEFMSAIYYDNVSAIEPRSLYDLADLVLRSANLPHGENWIIDGSLKGITATAQLPVDNIANLLQLIANAGECVLYQDREGKLHIEPLQSVETDYAITPSNSYTKTEMTLSKPLKQVIVKVYTYNKGNNGVTSTVSEVSAYVDSTVKAGETITIDNPLITSEDRAKSVGAWVANYLEQRMTLDSSWRADVRLDALDIVTNSNPYASSKVLMTDVEFSYNGSFKGTGQGKVIQNG